MTHTLSISGMSCGHCVRRVSKALASVEGLGVREVEVGRAVVDDGGDPGRVTRAIAAVRDAGYPASEPSS